LLAFLCKYDIIVDGATLWLQDLSQQNKEKRMYWFILFGTVIIGSVLLVLCVYWLGLAIKKQAQKPVKKFFAPIPRPGSFSFVSLEGKIVDLIENVNGWKIATKDRKGLKNAKYFETGTKEGFSNPLQNLLEEKLGVVWIGFFTTIRNFPDWKWSEFRQITVEEKGVKRPHYEIVAREAKPDERIESFFFQFPYPVILEDAEIEDNISVKIAAVFIVLHFHPIRVFFLNKDPIGLFNAMAISFLRNYVRNKTFDEVKGMKASAGAAETLGVEKDKKEDETLWKEVEKLNGVKILDDGNLNYDEINQLGLFGKFGGVIVRVEILQVEAVGDAAEAIEAAKLAELTGKAAIVTAEQEAIAAVAAADGRRKAAELDAAAQRMLNEQNAGYFASLPGGARMFAAAQVAGKDSSVSTWVEGKGDIEVTLPLPAAPDTPKPKIPKK
jgi:hypothetical protein